jgi:SAM-dependent methyltransferase
MTDSALKVPRNLRRGHRASDEQVSVEFAVELITHMSKHFGLADLGAAKLLDIGCGCKFTQAILDRNLPIGQYVGIDVYAEMIEFLQSNVDDPRFSFYHMNTHNEMYNQDGEPLTADIKLPIGEDKFDLICLFSVFTHLAPHDYVAMLKMLRAYVKPNGRLFYTVFVNEETSGGHGYIDFYARGMKSAENISSEKHKHHFIDALENKGPPDFVGMVAEQPLKVAMYSREHALTLVENTGWKVESLNDPVEEMQHYMVCKPA